MTAIATRHVRLRSHNLHAQGICTRILHLMGDIAEVDIAHQPGSKEIYKVYPLYTYSV